VKAILGVLTALFVLAACGSSSRDGMVSAGTYMKSICSALGPWETGLKARSGALKPPPTATAAQRKKAVQEFLRAVIDDTGSALTRLRAAGSPDVSGGKKLAADLVGAFAQLQATYARAAQQADKLPTRSVLALQDAVFNIASTVDSSLTNIGTRLGALETPELKRAAAKQPACQKLAARDG
jgi:hypothetical protein